MFFFPFGVKYFFLIKNNFNRLQQTLIIIDSFKDNISQVHIQTIPKASVIKGSFEARLSPETQKSSGYALRLTYIALPCRQSTKACASLPISSILNRAIQNNKYDWQKNILFVKEIIMNEIVIYFLYYIFFFFSSLRIFLTKAHT